MNKIFTSLRTLQQGDRYPYSSAGWQVSPTGVSDTHRGNQSTKGLNLLNSPSWWLAVTQGKQCRTGFLERWAQTPTLSIRKPVFDRSFPYLKLPAVQETRVWSLGCEDPLEKETATHSRILAWKISWTEVPGGLKSMGSQRVRHDWATNTNHKHFPYFSQHWFWSKKLLKQWTMIFFLISNTPS